jgi:hypothetical protein
VGEGGCQEPNAKLIGLPLLLLGTEHGTEQEGAEVTEAL